MTKFYYSSHRNQDRGLKARFWLYLSLLVIVIVGVVGQKKTVNKIELESQADLKQQRYLDDQQLELSLQNTQVSAFALTGIGVELLKLNQLEVATLVLDLAAQRDSNLRDAALYASFGKLAMADKLWSTDPRSAQHYTDQAASLLERAKLIDPIYGYTYELLAIAYENLGKIDLAQEARDKSQVFKL